jgi:hypothetical protein
MKIGWESGALAMFAVVTHALLAMPEAAAGEKAGGMRFRCESERSQPHYCKVDTGDGITLVKQLSASPCRQGTNWDYDRHGVWVSHRCRAEFITGKVDPASLSEPGSSVRCESKANRIEHCPAQVASGVRLVRILSSSACIENQDWGSDAQGIWVANGCRAEFLVGGKAAARNIESGAGSRITCESAQKQRQYCRATVERGVDLLRQLSRTRCVQGSNWDWEPGGIWVDLGCRAEFGVR